MSFSPAAADSFKVLSRVKTPYISFIIPVYNVREYLDSCVSSILSENRTDIEIILIDDGSTDGCGDICDKYASSDKRVNVIHTLNSGVSAARNTGLKYASGKWIWFVDADDMIATNSVKELANILTRNKVDTIIHGMTLLYDANKKTHIIPSPAQEGESPNSILNRISCYQNGMIIFSGEVIRKYGLQFPEGVKMGEDLDFQTRYFLNCTSIQTVDKPYYIWRQRPGSAMRQNGESDINNIVGVSQIINSLIAVLLRDPKLVQPWLCKRLRGFMQGILVSYVRLNNDLKQLYKPTIKNTLDKFFTFSSQHHLAIDKFWQFRLAKFNLSIYCVVLKGYWYIKSV